MAGFLDYLRLVLSWHYFEGDGESFLETAIAKPLDDLTAAAKQAVTQRFWRYALDEALPYLLQNYNLDKVEAFTPDQTRKQIADAWDTWEKAGSEEGILAEVGRLGYSLASLLPVWLYRESSDGTTDTIEFQPTLRPDHNPLFWPAGMKAPVYSVSHSRKIATEGEWGGREWWIDLNFHASSFFVVIHDPPFAFRRWGDPALWGKGLRWDALVTGDRVALRRLYLTIKKFNAAEWSCRGVVFTYSGRYLLGGTLLGMAVRTTYDAWACGFGGYIAHWDGTAWSEVQTPTTANLFGIWTVSEDLVPLGAPLQVGQIPPGGAYAVGREGTILHWNGSVWVLEPSGTFEILTGFAYTGRNRWVCGQNGTLLLNVGFGWSPYPCPVSTNLQKMWALSATDIWAVGSGGVAIHFDGANWTSVSTGTSQDLYSVWGIATNDVWAVGNNGTILHWDGATWSAATSPTSQHLFTVYGMADGRAVAAGDALVVYDGTSWKLASGSIPGRVWTVQGTVSDNFWAVTEQGWSYNLTIAGVVFGNAPWDHFNWDDGTRYDPKYIIKWVKENWEI